MYDFLFFFKIHISYTRPLHEKSPRQLNQLQARMVQGNWNHLNWSMASWHGKPLEQSGKIAGLTFGGSVSWWWRSHVFSEFLVKDLPKVFLNKSMWDTVRRHGVKKMTQEVLKWLGRCDFCGVNFVEGKCENSNLL